MKLPPSPRSTLPRSAAKLRVMALVLAIASSLAAAAILFAPGAVQGRGEDGGDRVHASYHPHGDKEPIFNTSLDVNRAANVPLEDSVQRIQQTQQQQLALQPNQNIDDPGRGPKIT